MKHALLVSCSVLAGLTAQAPTTVTTEPTGFLAKTLTVGGSEHRYVVYVPRGYTKEKPWPLIVFLNGMGECGADGWKQVSVGLGAAIMADWAKWPFVVVFPQKPTMDSEWVAHDAMVMGMLAKTEADYAIDPARRFLTGLSQGGAGTWALGSKHADVWAAIAPVCGYGKPADVAAALARMPIWAFHGEDDKAVPVKQSKDLCAAVNAAGGQALLSLYPKVGHNSWDKAYGTETLAEWFLAAPADRLGVHLLADVDRIRTAKVTLRDAMSSDGGPPFAAVTTMQFTLDSSGLGWSWRRAHGDPEHRDGPDPAPREGRLDAKKGRAFAAERLKQLRDGGVFALPLVVAPREPKGAVMAWNEYTLEIELEGRSGTCTFRRSLPRFALHDPRYESAVRAIWDCAKAMGALE